MSFQTYRGSAITDQPSQVNALAEASIDGKAVERIATEILDAIHEYVATRADVRAINDAHIENFLQKPIDPELVVAKLDRILRMQEAKRARELALNRSIEALKERLTDAEKG